MTIKINFFGLIFVILAFLKPALAEVAPPQDTYFDPVEYTLGADDAVEISVLRHPEFSGTYPVNLEGKIQYKFIGDIDVNGITKNDLQGRVKAILANFIVEPEVNISIMEYKSKVIYILGEVAQPGKYYMRANAVPIREAVVNAGLPIGSAAMRRCRLITPDKNGKARTKIVDLYSILYAGNLKHNIDMQPGDVLYVPATVMAKVVRVINPVTATVNGVASGPSEASRGKTAITQLAR